MKKKEKNMRRSCLHLSFK